MTAEAKIRITTEMAAALVELGKLGKQISAVKSEASGLGKVGGADVLAVDLGKVGGAAEQAASAVDKVGAAGSALGQSFKVGASIFALNQVAGAARALVNDLLDAKIASEKLLSGASFAVGGDFAKAAREMVFVAQASRDLGLAVSTTAEQYFRLAAASKGTALEGENTRRIFMAVAKAATALNLSADETAGALQAVQQMISKGKVSAEELSGQLGERLPGALQITARALGVTTQQLFAMLEAGELTAAEVLPKLAAQLEKEFGPAAERAADQTRQALNRLENAWLGLKQAFADSGVGDAIKSSLSGVTTMLDNVTAGMQRAKQEGAGFLGQIGGGLQGAFSQAGQSFGALLTQQQQLQESLASMKASWAASTLYARQIWETEQKLAGVQVEIARRKRESASADTTGQPTGGASGGDQAAVEAAQNARAALKKLVDGARTDTQKLADEKARFMAQYKALLSPEELAQAEAAFAQQAAKRQQQQSLQVAQAREGYDQELDLRRDAIARELQENDRSYRDALQGFQNYLDTRSRLQAQQVATEIEQLEKRKAAEQETVRLNTAQLGSASGSQRVAIDQAIARSREVIARLDADIEKKTRDQAAHVRDRAAEEARIIDNLRRQREEVDAMLRRATGSETADSVAQSVRQNYEQQLQAVMQNDQDPAPLLKLIDVETERAKFQLLLRQFQGQKDQLAVAEQAVQADVDAGLITQSQGEERLLALRRESLAALQQQSAELANQSAALDEVAGKPQVAEKVAAKQAQNDVKVVADARSEWEKTAKSSATSAMSDLIKDLATRSKTAGDAVRDMAKSIASSMLDLASKKLGESLVNSLFGAFGGAGGAGAGAGAGGGLGQIIASFFHTGGVVGSGDGFARAVPSAAWSLAPRYHSGGIAGLAPNEVPAILQAGEEVLTKDDPRHVRNSGKSLGGLTVYNQVSITGQDGGSDQRSAADDLLQAVNAAIDAWAIKQSRPGGLLTR